jgi:hypothetical protein
VDVALHNILVGSRQLVLLHTPAASVFVLLYQLLRQYLYFGTHKAQVK